MTNGVLGGDSYKMVPVVQALVLASKNLPLGTNLWLLRLHS